jgi:hypothetical protein
MDEVFGTRNLARCVHVLARIRSDLPAWNTCSIHTPARCGKNIVSNSETVTDQDHQAEQPHHVPLGNSVSSCDLAFRCGTSMAAGTISRCCCRSSTAYCGACSACWRCWSL